MKRATISAGPALALIFFSGCTLVSVGGKPNVLPAGVPSPMGRGLIEFRAAFHVHCHLSHDSKGTLADIAQAAKNLGIDTVILTDHYEPGNVQRAPRGVVEGVLFLSGVEMGCDGGGSILSAPLAADFAKRGRSSCDLLSEFSEQGSLNVLGHVEKITDWGIEPFSAFEVYNLHAEFSSHSKWKILGRILCLPVDTFLEVSVRNPVENLAIWDRELARGRRLAPLGGHDAHSNIVILGSTVGTYQELFRLFSNHIVAAEWSVKGIADAIRQGHTFLSFDFLGDATGFSFSYGKPGAPSGYRAILGEEAPHVAGNTFEVQVPDQPGPLEVRIIKDGSLLLETAASRFEVAPPGPGVYRVEVLKGERMWIISAPIYLGD